MPFASKRQARKLFATNPAVAREFAAATPSIKALPETAPGAALRAASKRRRVGHRKTRGNLTGPPQAFGQRIEGPSTSTTRIGY